MLTGSLVYGASGQLPSDLKNTLELTSSQSAHSIAAEAGATRDLALHVAGYIRLHQSDNHCRQLKRGLRALA